MKEPSQAGQVVVRGKPLYHMTPHENLESIFKAGLLPAHGNFVSLCENPLSWYRDYARLAVDIDAFRRDNPGVRVTTWLPDLDEVCVWGTIPPKYIRLCDGDKEPSQADKAILWNRERPLTPDELKGFGPARKPGATKRPYVRISGPDKEDGPKGFTIEVGVKGTF